VGVAKEGYLAQSRTLTRVKVGKLPPLQFELENARRAEIGGRLANLEKEMEAWEKRLEALEKRRSGFVISGSAQQEIALEREIEAAEKHIEDLSADTSTLRDELASVVDP
jgi:chromosome segregation ATPase